jgi:predicted phage replisome organizer
MSETHKYYWLKLKRDFFKRHDIVIIEAMPNGKDYILFYLKLLAESVDHDGNLRFSETIPYSEDMLATITRTNVDIVRSAVKIFSELGMMDRFDDGTLFMSQVEGMIGSETNDAIRMRIARENSKQLLIAKEKSEQCSEPFKNRSPELELELELEKDIEKEIEEEKGVVSPIDPVIKKDTGNRISKAIESWNELGLLPRYALTSLTMFPQERADCMRIMTAFTDEQTIEAMETYLAIKQSPEHDPPIYQSMPGFIKGGVAKFVTESSPWELFKKKDKGFETSDERDERRREEIRIQLGMPK